MPETKAINKYRQYVVDKGPSWLGEDADKTITIGLIGASEELGELAGLVKKNLCYDKPLDRDEAILELGDLMHYLEYIMIYFNTNTQEVQDKNIEKLDKRFPGKFTKFDAIARKDEE